MPRILALLTFALLIGAGPACAQGITRVCDQVVDAHGQNNCPETFASSPQVGLSTTVKQVKAIGGIVSIVHCWNPNSQQIYVQLFQFIARQCNAWDNGSGRLRAHCGNVYRGMVYIPAGSWRVSGSHFQRQRRQRRKATGAPNSPFDCDIAASTDMRKIIALALMS